MRAAAVARSRTPALNAVDCSKLSPWLAEARSAASVGKHATDAPDAVTPLVEISPPDVVKRRTVSWHRIAAEVVQLTRWAKVEIRFCAPLHLPAVYEQEMRDDGETMVQGFA